VSLGSEQVHVPALKVTSDPLSFLRLLSKHRVTYSFAPNFFLAMLRDSLVSVLDFTPTLRDGLDPVSDFEIPKLKALISGGEANFVATCNVLTRQLRCLGVGSEVIRPGFGMTETCAGSIYSSTCPSNDLAKGHEFASLGSCIEGIEMRVMRLDDGGKQHAPCDMVGELQIRGPVVFENYYNDPVATSHAFKPNGWFCTGDLARIDASGNLNLVGRTKDTIIINGLKWNSNEIEAAIDEAGIAGLSPSFTVAVPRRGLDAPTEEICIVYSPKYAEHDDLGRAEATRAITKVVTQLTGRKPAYIIPLPQDRLIKSSLGKISRSRVRAELESGEFAPLEQQNAEALARHWQLRYRPAKTPTEKIIQGILAKLLREDISLNSSIFELGIDSMSLNLLGSMIQEALGFRTNIPMNTLLK
jgi:acyl-CoA synthetase (AMP-forming)/AMP-acid ligase II/acyl carrier protein